MSDVRSDCKRHAAQVAIRSIGGSLRCVSCSGARTFDPIGEPADTQLTDRRYPDATFEHAMLPLVWKLFVHQLLLACRLAQEHGGEFLLSILPPGVRQLRNAHRMNALALRLASMQGKIAAFEASIVNGAFCEAVDVDFTLRKMLQGLKGDIQEIRCEMAGVPREARTGPGGARLCKAITRLHAVAQATYLSADRLLWEIDEHNLKYHQEGKARPDQRPQ